MSKFHQAQAWTNLRARAVAAARKADAPCPVCGRPIDYTASGRTPWGPSGDHIISVALLAGCRNQPRCRDQPDGEDQRILG